MAAAAMNQNPVISCRDLGKRFQLYSGKKFTAIEGISLDVYPGEFLVLLGPSGCGKSTLLRILSGLDTASGGEVAYDPAARARPVGFVFQQFALLPWLTVAENVALGLGARGESPERVRQVVREQLETFGLSKFSESYPRDLSGGMKQRVGLARAFAVDPGIIFMDEPFSALDSFIAKELREELLRVWQSRNVTVIMVTHNISEAVELADRIVVMSARPGKIERIVPNRLARPRPMRGQPVFELEDELYRLVKP